ncbi:cobalt-precorrin-6A reductase [Millisia brevis]|uniref:cobalt-precorrin-6A reductase n=1 Tax=Millisia brevis TaxID=264148 RepID=UPI000A05F1EA|nr:cobalt-precorrin-6A reductase [Millisia brevis]
MTRILILGGTIEARTTAQVLVERPGVRVITSLAGRTDHPIRPAGELRIGGFGGADGLRDYLLAERIDRVLDATHPFAARISANARLACRAAGVPLVVLTRPRWAPEPSDRWLTAASPERAAALVADLPAGTVLLTIGRGSLDAFAPIDRHRFVIRSVDAPTGPLPARHEIVLARGPFTLADELELMRARGVDVLVTKNSGGPAAAAKLDAARTIGATVVVIDRPTPDPTDADPTDADPAGTDPTDADPAGMDPLAPDVPVAGVVTVTDPREAIDQLLDSATPTP